MSKTTWKKINTRLKHAQTLGEQFAYSSGCVELPVDPFGIAKREHPLLKVIAENFGDAFDGQLEYHRGKNRFLAFINTKYDDELPLGTHHKRTRFSLGHELGHYFLETHRAYLMGNGTSHQSDSEFKSDATIEREADAFASGLLMPRRLVGPIINRTELSLNAIIEASDLFQTSVVSTGIRSVQVTDFPCGLAAIKNGRIAWTFVSEALIEAGCYPGDRSAEVSGSALKEWENFRMGNYSQSNHSGFIGRWFRTYDRGDKLDDICLTEEYLPAPVMNTLLVLLTVDENDLNFEEAEY